MKTDPCAMHDAVATDKDGAAGRNPAATNTNCPHIRNDSPCRELRRLAVSLGIWISVLCLVVVSLMSFDAMWPSVGTASFWLRETVLILCLAIQIVALVLIKAARTVDSA